jgi:Contractile injection system tube protein
MSGQLTRARLIRYQPDGNNLETGKAITFDFNPETLTLKVSTGQQQERSRRGRQQVQNVGATAATLSFEAIFDTTRPKAHDDVTRDSAANDDTALDVRVRTGPIADLVATGTGSGGGQDNENAPRRVRFQWGSILFDGVITSHQETFDYFAPSGVPLRSKVQITLSQQDFRYEVSADQLARAAAATPPATARDAATAQGADSLLDLAPDDLALGFSASLQAGFSIDAGVRLEAELGISADVGLSLSAGIRLDASAALDVFGSAALSVGAGLDVAGVASAGFSASAGVSAGASFSTGAGVLASASFSAGARVSVNAGGPASARVSASAGVPASVGFSASAGDLGQAGLAPLAPSAATAPPGQTPPATSWAPDAPAPGSRAAALAAVVNSLRANGAAAATEGARVAPLPIRGSPPTVLPRTPRADNTIYATSRLSAVTAVSAEPRPSWEAVLPLTATTRQAPRPVYTARCCRHHGYGGYSCQ